MQTLFGPRCAAICMSIARDRRTPDLVFHGALRTLCRLLLANPGLRAALGDEWDGAGDAFDTGTAQRALSVLALRLTLMQTRNGVHDKPRQPPV
jgi:hypothetical protein